MTVTKKTIRHKKGKVRVATLGRGIFDIVRNLSRVRRIVLFAGMVAILGLGATSYFFVSKTGPFTASADTVNGRGLDKRELKPKDDTIADKIVHSETASEKEDTEEAAINQKGSGQVVQYTPKCRGAGCPTANAAYSIVTNKTITVAAGTSAGPFTATTSNGWTVDWSTPTCLSGGRCPFGFGYGSLKGSSLQYYIRADQDVPAGNYTMVMSAIHSASETLVRTTLTVSVVSPSSSSPTQSFSPPPQTYSPAPYPTMSPAAPTPTPSVAP